MAAPGRLYLVSTPIGNPEDITQRALRILKEAAVIVCEERREGERLLARYGIRAPLLEQLNEHNEAAASWHILEHLRAGKDVAVISDAGTPVFSDPGRILVGHAIEASIDIVPVPGASSLLPALTLSGFPIDGFVFCGFLSPKANRRRAELNALRREERTMVLMDTPYRLAALLKDVAEVVGADRKACIAFNLTMPDEAVYRGTAAELSAMVSRRNLKGEFVLVLAGRPR